MKNQHYIEAGVIDLSTIRIGQETGGGTIIRETVYMNFVKPTVTATFNINANSDHDGNMFLNSDSNTAKVVVKATPKVGKPYALKNIQLKVGADIVQTVTPITSATEYTFSEVTIQKGVSTTIKVIVNDENLTGDTQPSATYTWGKYVYWGITTKTPSALTLADFTDATNTTMKKKMYGASASMSEEFPCATNNGKPCFAIPHDYSSTKEVIQAYLGGMMYIDNCFIKQDNGYDIYCLSDDHNVNTKYGFKYPKSN